MLIADIYSRIGELVSDPDLTEYKDAMPNAFETSMCGLIRSGDFLPEEVPALVEPYLVSLTVSGLSKNVKETDLSDLDKVLKIVDVLDDEISFKPITKDEMRSILQNPLRLPVDGEGYWYVGDNKLYCILSETQSEVSGVTVSAVRNPDPATWNGVRTTDLIADLNYGLAFIQKCIVASAQFIKAQISGEMENE